MAQGFQRTAAQRPKIRRCRHACELHECEEVLMLHMGSQSGPGSIKVLRAHAINILEVIAECMFL